MVGEPRVCQECGEPLGAGATLCGACGAPTPAPQELGALMFDSEILLLRRGALLRQLGMTLLLPTLILFLLLIALEWPLDAARLAGIVQALAIVGSVLLALALAAFGLVYGGRYLITYRLDEQGAASQLRGGAALRNKIIALLLALSGQPGATGAGLLAQARQREFVAWEQVHRVETSPARREIALHNQRRQLMVIACDASTFDPALDYARQAMERAQAGKQTQNRQPKGVA
jgi:hypothetical protein